MAGMSFVIYSSGSHALTCDGAREMRTQLDEIGGVGWVYLEDPPPADVEELGEVFALPELAIQDALRGRQRSKLEDYDDVHFLALRRPIPGDRLAEMHVVAGAAGAEGHCARMLAARLSPTPTCGSSLPAPTAGRVVGCHSLALSLPSAHRPPNGDGDTEDVGLAYVNAHIHLRAKTGVYAGSV